MFAHLSHSLSLGRRRSRSSRRRRRRQRRTIMTRKRSRIRTRTRVIHYPVNMLKLRDPQKHSGQGSISHLLLGRNQIQHSETHLIRARFLSEKGSLLRWPTFLRAIHKQEEPVWPDQVSAPGPPVIHRRFKEATERNQLEKLCAYADHQ